MRVKARSSKMYNRGMRKTAKVKRFGKLIKKSRAI